MQKIEAKVLQKISYLRKVSVNADACVGMAITTGQCASQQVIPTSIGGLSLPMASLMVEIPILCDIACYVG